MAALVCIMPNSV